MDILFVWAVCKDLQMDILFVWAVCKDLQMDILLLLLLLVLSYLISTCSKITFGPGAWVVPS